MRADGGEREDRYLFFTAGLTGFWAAGSVDKLLLIKYGIKIASAGDRREKDVSFT